MADQDLSPAELEKRLWKTVEDVKIGMLGVAGGDPQHLQPMTAFAERDQKRLWIFTKKDTDLAKEVADGGRAGHFTFVSDDKEVWLSIGGDLTEDFDRERLERFWEPTAAAWYPDGKDDPELTMLRFDLVEARVWVSKRGPFKFGFEIAKGALTRDMPDLGGRGDVTFQ